MRSEIVIGNNRDGSNGQRTFELIESPTPQAHSFDYPYRIGEQHPLLSYWRILKKRKWTIVATFAIILVLAIMKQESQFKPNAKSPSAARGLLQLTIDAAQKYGPRAGLKQVSDDSLYQPGTNIAIGTEYIAELSRMFAGLAEAVAASYNGGEDNVARWLARTNQSDAGVFTAEIGFTESKNYVFKVMSFYRAYGQLYDSNLNRR